MTRSHLIRLAAGTVLLSPVPARAQLLRPYFVTPDFGAAAPGNWEYSHWDKFYTPHDANGTLAQNRNYPDLAAPNGYAVKLVGSDEIGPLGDVEEYPAGSGSYRYVGAFSGPYVWDVQSFSAAVGSGFTGAMPTNPNPANPLTIFHADNPSIRQHASSAFIIGAGFTGNIYTPFERVSYDLEDAVNHPLGSVMFQFQNQGRDMDLDSLRLRYDKDGTTVDIPAKDIIIEREAFASHSGFTFTTRVAAEWDVAALGIRSYRLVWKAAGSSSSLQEVLLDTTDTYVRDKGLPAARTFVGGAGPGWDEPGNWTDAYGANASPVDHANLVLSGGAAMDLGSATRKVSLLKANPPGDFAITGSGSFELGTGLEAEDAETHRTITFGVPVRMSAFNFFDVGRNVTISLPHPFSGDTGFEKRGEGELFLGGDNTFTGALFLSGGTLRVSGSNNHGIYGRLDKTYIYLGELELESTGSIGGSGVPVEIGSTPYEIVGESRPSILTVRGERTFAHAIKFTGGYNPKVLTFTDTGSGSVCSSTIDFHNEALNGEFGVETSTGDVQFSTPQPSDAVNFTGPMTLGSTLTGLSPYAVRKTGPGTVTFSGSDKNYRLQTKVEEGLLLLTAGTNLASGNSVHVAAGAKFTANGDMVISGNASLTVDGVLDGGGTILRSGTPTIGGSGTIAKALTISAGTSLSPGNGAGTLRLTGNQTWGSNGSLVFEVAGAGTPAVQDQVVIEGGLNLNATAAATFMVKLKSLTLSGGAGPVADFNGFGRYSWTLATATAGITGFDPAAVAIDTTGFANIFNGTFSVEVEGSSLVLRYSAGAGSGESFANWAAALPQDQRGANQDPDHDGRVNLVEFATGGSATARESGGVLAFRREEGRSVLECTLAEPMPAGVTVKILGSSDLAAGSWKTLAAKAGSAAWQAAGSLASDEPVGTRRTHRLTLPADSDPALRYFRLEFRNEE